MPVLVEGVDPQYVRQAAPGIGAAPTIVRAALWAARTRTVWTSTRTEIARSVEPRTRTRSSQETRTWRQHRYARQMVC